uniref:Uncharacterized protein n=1 Tax=Anopheles atroparvus TaxID=41427 RepID=A0A182IWK4_ANOAO
MRRSLTGRSLSRIPASAQSTPEAGIVLLEYVEQAAAHVELAQPAALGGNHLQDAIVVRRRKDLRPQTLDALVQQHLQATEALERRERVGAQDHSQQVLVDVAGRPQALQVRVDLDYQQRVVRRGAVRLALLNYRPNRTDDGAGQFGQRDLAQLKLSSPGGTMGVRLTSGTFPLLIMQDPGAFGWLEGLAGSEGPLSDYSVVNGCQRRLFTAL